MEAGKNLLNHVVDAKSLIEYLPKVRYLDPFLGQKTHGAITINYPGQFGNKLFPLTLGLFLAKKNNLAISYPKIPFLDSYIPSSESLPRAPVYKKINNFSLDYQNQNISLPSGYYQHSELFNLHREEILSTLFDLRPVKLNTEDVVMHVRLDGFQHNGGSTSNIIHPTWYKNILSKLKFDKLYIVLSTVSGKIWKQDKNIYLSNFSEYNPVIVSSKSERHDFDFMRSFKYFICSNSTFSWWAAFTSQASKKFMPPFWEGASSRLSSIDNGVIVNEKFNFFDFNAPKDIIFKSPEQIEARMSNLPFPLKYDDK